MQPRHALRCEQLTKGFGNGHARTIAVQAVQQDFEQGKIYSIIGKSGSGKSTLLYLLSGLMKPDDGWVAVDGQRLDQLNERQLAVLRRQKIGFVFQDYRLLPELTVQENILLPQILDGQPPDETWCQHVLDQLGLSAMAQKYPYQMSGGEQQRVAIGRAIINRPGLLFADEPTGNLDMKTGEAVLDFLLSAQELYHPTILLVTHDLDIARCADHLLRMEDGHLFSSGKGETDDG